MAVLHPIPPQSLKAAFERAGYKAIDEDEYNWLMEKEDGIVFLIPKKGDLVTVPIMSAAQHHAPGSGLGQAILDEVQRYVASAATGDD